MSKKDDVLPQSSGSLYFILKEISYLNENDLGLVAKHGQPLDFQRGSVLFEQGEVADHFYIILRGALKLVKKSEGDRQTLVEIVTNRELVGAALMARTEQTVYPVTAQVMSPTQLVKLTKEFFLNHWKPNTQLMSKVLEQMSKRMCQIQDDKSMQRMSLEEKLAYYLTEKIALIEHLFITRQDLADAFGATNESVVRVLSQWQKQNLISTEKHEITIHDMDKLRKIWKRN